MFAEASEAMIAPPLSLNSTVLVICSLGTLKLNFSLPLPETYSARWLLLRIKHGLPFTVTLSLKMTAMLSAAGSIFLIVGPLLLSGSHVPAKVQAGVICSGFGEFGAVARLSVNHL